MTTTIARPSKGATKATERTLFSIDSPCLTNRGAAKRQNGAVATKFEQIGRQCSPSPENRVAGMDGSSDRPQNATELLLAWGRGEKCALDELVPLVHDELHRIAHRH